MQLGQSPCSLNYGVGDLQSPHEPSNNIKPTIQNNSTINTLRGVVSQDSSQFGVHGKSTLVAGLLESLIALPGGNRPHARRPFPP